MNQIDDVPLAALGGVNGGENDILFVQERRSWPGPPVETGGSSVRSARKAATAGRLLGQELELVQVADPHLGLLVALFEKGRIETPHAFDLRGQRRLQVIRGQFGARSRTRSCTGPRAAAGTFQRQSACDYLGLFMKMLQRLSRPTGADAFEQLQHAHPAQLVAQVFEDPQESQQILDVGGFQEIASRPT